MREQIQLLPRNSMPDVGGSISWNESKRRFTEGNNDVRGQSPQGMWLALNHVFRKYGFISTLRKAHFFGQVFKETGALCSTRENGNAEYFRKMYENYTASDAAEDFDHKPNWLQNLGLVGGAGGLPARPQFFRYTYFILNDRPELPAENGLSQQKEEGL